MLTLSHTYGEYHDIRAGNKQQDMAGPSMDASSGIDVSAPPWSVQVALPLLQEQPAQLTSLMNALIAEQPPEYACVCTERACRDDNDEAVGRPSSGAYARVRVRRTRELSLLARGPC